MVEDAFYVFHLMGGDDDELTFVAALADKVAKLLLARDVKAVGWLVHQQHFGMRSHGKGHENLFALTER